MICRLFASTGCCCLVKVKVFTLLSCVHLGLTFPLKLFHFWAFFVLAAAAAAAVTTADMMTLFHTPVTKASDLPQSDLVSWLAYVFGRRIKRRFQTTLLCISRVRETAIQFQKKALE